MQPLPRFDPEQTLVLVIDHQERLAAAMDPERVSAALLQAARLVEGARLLDIPVIATEQYPKGLGPTAEPVRSALGDIQPFSKRVFSCMGVPDVRTVLDEHPHAAVTVVGMETHICVWQTVRDLRSHGRSVAVVADAVCSRQERNERIGLNLCERAGAVLVSTETLLFDWIGSAAHPQFRAISRLVR